MKEHLTQALSLLVNMTPKRVVRKMCGEITPIFMLHRLSHQDPVIQQSELEHVKWCFQYLRKNHYNPITLKELASAYKNNKKIPAKSVVFTIDDGFNDQYEIAAPLFNQFDIPYTCFVITDFLDGKLWPWDDQISYILRKTNLKKITSSLPAADSLTLTISQSNNISQAIDLVRGKLKVSQQSNLYEWLTDFYKAAEVDIPALPPSEFKPMTWQQAQSIIDQGHDIAPHTMTHRILSQLSDDESKNEISGSFQRVNEKLNGVSSLFAYPTGRPQDYTSREVQCLNDINALATVNTTATYSKPLDPIHELPRFALPKTRFDFIQYLSFFDSMKRNMMMSRYDE